MKLIEVHFLNFDKLTEFGHLAVTCGLVAVFHNRTEEIVGWFALQLVIIIIAVVVPYYFLIGTLNTKLK